MTTKIRAEFRRSFNLPAQKSTAKRSAGKKFPSLFFSEEYDFCVPSIKNLSPILVLALSYCSSLRNRKEAAECPSFYPTFIEAKYYIIDLCVFSTGQKKKKKRKKKLNMYVLKNTQTALL